MKLAANRSKAGPTSSQPRPVSSAPNRVTGSFGDYSANPRRDVPIVQADDVVVEQRNDCGREGVDIVHRGLLAVAERSIVALPRWSHK